MDYPTFLVNRRYFHLVVILVGLLSRSDKLPDIWNTKGFSGNVFGNPPASSSPYPAGFNHWISNVTEDTSPHVTSRRQIPDTALNPRFQSGPSAGNSFDAKERIFSKDYGADQQRLQISELHFVKFPTPTTFACWKIRFKTEVCTCSQFPSKSPTTVITANGELQTHEEAVYVKELDMFLTMKVFEDTPAVLTLGKLCDEHGYSYEWINGQKPHLIKNGIRIQCHTENFVPIVVPGLSTSSSSSLLSSTSMTALNQEIDHPTSSSSSSTSPTITSSTVSSDSVARQEQRDLCGIDS